MKKMEIKEYMSRMISHLKANGKLTTANNYHAALASFNRYLPTRNITLDRLTETIVKNYEMYLQSRCLCKNTISFYMRILRAVYNRAVMEGLTKDRHPFRKVYTGVARTVKRALTLQSLRNICRADLNGDKCLEYARDMFMLSFYLRGMSFVDMCFLKKTDLKEGCLSYRRRKTGRQLRIAWLPEMQAIIDKYGSHDSDYLLPIITRRGVNPRTVYKNAGYNINHNLKRVARLAGEYVNLTMYVARHSWASLARAGGVSISVISEAMGHDSETTTQIYLASLETEQIDRANAIVISMLNNSTFAGES